MGRVIESKTAEMHTHTHTHTHRGDDAVFLQNLFAFLVRSARFEIFLGLCNFPEPHNVASGHAYI